MSFLPSREYRSRFTNEETVSFCLRVMVGVIILYDHVHPVGAFAKTSKIDVSYLFYILANSFHDGRARAVTEELADCSLSRRSGWGV